MSDLTTAAAVQAYLQIPATQATALLASLVTAVSDWVEMYCSRAFLQATYTETYNTVLGNALPLRQFPIVSVQSVTVFGRDIPASPSPTQYGYTFDDTMLYLRHAVFPKEVQSTTVSYTAGFAAVPPSLAQAVVEMVALKYRRIQNIGKNAGGIAGETTTFTMSDVPGYVLPVLDVFRRTYQV